MINNNEQTMQDLINEYGKECLIYEKDIYATDEITEFLYNGFRILKCITPNNVTYFTIINLKNNQHVHSNTFNMAKLICDCCNELTTYGVCDTKKYFRRIRNGALRLLEIPINKKIQLNNVCE